MNPLIEIIDSLNEDQMREASRILQERVAAIDARTGLSSEERRMLEQGDRLGAAKHVRFRLGLTLREAAQLLERQGR